MFEDLKKAINIENLNKIKKNNNQLRYKQEESSEEHPQHVDDSLSDYQIEMEQRQENYRKIFESGQPEQEDLQLKNIIKRNNTTPPHKIKKMEHELEISNEKLKLQQQAFKREIQFIQEVHRRREEWLKSQIEKLKMMNEKIKEENGKIKEMKMEISQLSQIKQILQKRLQQKDVELKEMNNRMLSSEAGYKKLISQEFSNISQSEDSMKKFVDKIKYLEQESLHWKKLSEDKDRKNTILNSQINTLKNKINQDQNNNINQIRKIKDTYEHTIEKLQLSTKELKKRNRQMEETFIQKMGQMTKLQMTLISSQHQNTSHRISQHQNTSHRISRHKENQNTSLNLQEESPIRPKEKEQSSIKKVQNPEIKECYCCAKKVKKIKQKLGEANHKILELLQHKIRLQSMNSYHYRNRICSWTAKR